MSFGSGTIRSWDRERGFREIRSNGGSASTRLRIGPYMVAGRICLYIGRARKRGRIRNGGEQQRELTHILCVSALLNSFLFFFSFFSYACVGVCTCVHKNERLMCLAARNGKRRGRDLDCPQPRRSTDKNNLLTQQIMTRFTN